MSHTVKVDVQMKDFEAVKAAAIRAGVQVLGEGNHRLYSGVENGLGIQLKGWRFPLVIHTDGSVSFDNYNGSWGNISDLDHFKEEYALSCAEMECARLGWQTLMDPAKRELTVFHPEGGQILVSAGGEIDATGFIGSSCTEATAQLEAALGKTMVDARKPEYNQVQINQGELES